MGERPQTSKGGTSNDGQVPGDYAMAELAEQEPLSLTGLVSEHHESLYRYAFRLAGSQPDAEDLVQQTFLMAQQRIHQLREPGRARQWLFAVLRNTFLKSCRRTPPTNATSLDVAPENWPQETPDENNWDLEQLQLALNSLPDESRLILTMFYFEQASYKEIAEQLELKMGTVMSRLARAKEKLKRQLFQLTARECQKGK